MRAPFSLAAVLVAAAANGGEAGPGPANGFPTEQQVPGGPGLGELASMLWKYTARCALREGQELEAPDAKTGKAQKFLGLFGVAPEWHGGTCDRACQEKVSSCLIALTNRTGKHVMLSLISAAPSMGPKLQLSEEDLPFPHQEGAFFGNLLSGGGEAYACRGRGAEKGAQVKRFCALEPASCSGLGRFEDAGRCDDVCKLKCTRLADGTERCAASSCTDPRGRVWEYPITAYLRNKIEAGNADEITGAVAREEAIQDLDDGDAVRFARVDFGGPPGTVRTFAAGISAPRSQGKIEILLDGTRRLGVLAVRATGGVQKEQTTRIAGKGVTGPHDLVLKIVGGHDIGRLATIEIR